MFLDDRVSASINSGCRQREENSVFYIFVKPADLFGLFDVFICLCTCKRVI